MPHPFPFQTSGPSQTPIHTQDFSLFFAAPPRLSPKLSPAIFFGTPYGLNQDTRPCLISIRSGGQVQAAFPYHFSLKPLNCYLLLYTHKGCGKLTFAGHTCLLSPRSLLFLNCSAPFEVETSVSPWRYTVFFLEGTPLDFYYRCLPPGQIPLHTLPTHSPILRSLHSLEENKTTEPVKNKLADHKLLTDILTDFLLEGMASNQEQEKIPPYLAQIKEAFDLQYQTSYTLDRLAEQYSVSKYRLCREFHHHFGLPPLQYVNERRMEAAKSLLLNTDLRIHEIGSQIGIENTNHFIYLFKRYAGTTPLAFRRST